MMLDVSRDQKQEARRLAALDRYAILDTPPEASFDRVVAIVAAVFDVPFAMISLVDRERCWYKARVGMPSQEFPRTDNMCDTVMAQDGVFIITDTMVSPPEVVRPLVQIGMRFYIGVPLRSPDGIKLGTVCAVGSQPRIVTEHEQQILTDLAAIVIDELELRLAARRMAEIDQTLHALNQRLAVANRNKSEFLASMSHELRTPLNGILGASELLRDGLFGPLSDKQREYIDDIAHCGQHLLSLIEEILDLSRIEAGQVDLRLETFGVASFMERCTAMIRGSVANKAQAITVQLPEPNLLFHVDERRMTQVMCNLLSNAVKFTPACGTITFRAWQQEHEIVFAIEDEGPGILHDLQDRIFEQFFRIPSDQEGTGLGLPLAKRLVELHGGRIWVESDEGAGSRFFVAVPSMEPDAALNRPPAL